MRLGCIAGDASHGSSFATNSKSPRNPRSIKYESRHLLHPGRPRANEDDGLQKSRALSVMPVTQLKQSTIAILARWVDEWPQDRCILIKEEHGALRRML